MIRPPQTLVAAAVLLTAFGCTRGDDADALWSHRAFRFVAGKPLEFRIPPGSRQVIVRTQTELPAASFSSTRRHQLETRSGIAHGFRYSLRDDAGHVIAQGDWHGSARFHEYTEPGRGVAAPRRFLAADPASVLSEVESLLLPFEKPLPRAATLRLEAPTRDARLRAPLFRVGSFRDIPNYRRRLGWVRLPPALREMAAMTASADSGALLPQELDNVMRWKEEPRAPIGAPGKDFVSLAMTSRPLAGSEMQPTAPAHGETLVGPQLFRTLEIQSARPIRAALCADAVAELAAANPRPTVVTVQYYADRFTPPKTLFVGALKGSHLTEPMLIPPGFVELRADSPVFADLRETEGTDAASCTPRDPRHLVDPARRTAGTDLFPGTTLALAVVHGLRVDDPTPLRIQAYLEDLTTTATLTYTVRDADARVLRRGSERARPLASEHTRALRYTGAAPLAEPVQWIFHLPAGAQSIEFTASAHFVLTAAVRVESTVPVVLVPPPIGEIATSWVTVPFGQTESETLVVTSPAPTRATSTTWAPFEPLETPEGHFVLEQKQVPDPRFDDAAHTYAEVRLDAKTTQSRFFAKPSVPAHFASSRLLYANPGGQRRTIAIHADGRCYWEGEIAGAAGEIALPPTAGFVDTSRPAVFEIRSTGPLTVWIEGLVPMGDLAGDEVQSYHRRFAYALHHGKAKHFRGTKAPENLEQAVNLQYVPKTPLRAGQVAEILVEWKTPLRTPRWEPRTGWTTRARRFRISASELGAPALVWDEAFRPTETTASFFFPLESDVPADAVDLAVTLIAGPEGLISLSSAFPGLAQSKNAETGYDPRKTIAQGATNVCRL